MGKHGASQAKKQEQPHWFMNIDLHLTDNCRKRKQKFQQIVIFFLFSSPLWKTQKRQKIKAHLDFPFQFLKFFKKSNVLFSVKQVPCCPPPQTVPPPFFSH